MPVSRGSRRCDRESEVRDAAEEKIRGACSASVMAEDENANVGGKSSGPDFFLAGWGVSGEEDSLSQENPACGVRIFSSLPPANFPRALRGMAFGEALEQTVEFLFLHFSSRLRRETESRGGSAQSREPSDVVPIAVGKVEPLRTARADSPEVFEGKPLSSGVEMIALVPGNPCRPQTLSDVPNDEPLAARGGGERHRGQKNQRHREGPHRAGLRRARRTG